jgi:hypothetical protein
LEFVNNIFAPILFSLNGFLNGPLEKIYVKLEGPLICGLDIGQIQSNEV